MNLDPDAAMTFLDFVVERHKVWERRQLGAPAPWSEDPILASEKFTNVFRVLDPGTQFVFTDLAADDPSPRDLLMRLFLYRHTGRVEVWRYLYNEMAGYPTVDDLDDVLEVFKEYRGDAHVRTRTSDPRNAGRKTRTDFKRSVFTGAYLVFPQSQVKGTDKLESIVGLTKRLFVGHGPNMSTASFFTARSQAERFASLRSNKGVADFMSMQILTDWSYLHGTDDDPFVVCGPGAKKGAAALAPGAKAEDVLRWACGSLWRLSDCPRLEPHDEVSRLPSYMDVQNCLCEFSKYIRYSERVYSGPMKRYTPSHPGPQPDPVLPRHW